MTKYYIGLDLGQKRDYTAIVVVEHSHITLPDRDPATFAFLTRTETAVRHAERIPLGTPYPEVIFRVSKMVHNSCLNGSITLLVDATGLGTPVVDHLRRSKLNCKLDPITITAQLKRDLLANLQFLFEENKLQIAHNLHLLDAVLEELQDLRPDGSQHTHDDLAIALALAAWPLRPRQLVGPQPHPLPIYFTSKPWKEAA